MRITFLGTGTSTGVPQIGCKCQVCHSSDPRNRRLRTSALVETDRGNRILIDCGPDFRQQMLTVPFGQLHAVLITHEHYDHVGGIDDLRPFCKFGDIDIYGDRLTYSALQTRFSYCFASTLYPGVPHLNLHTVEGGKTFHTLRGNEEITALNVMHGRLPILGYRIGDLTYITDLSELPDETCPLLRGTRLLVVNALRTEPHASHQSIPEAIELARRIGAPQTFFTHMSHQAPLHSEFSRILPGSIQVAYDGLQVEL